jgi:hypothetical protein
VPWDTGRNHQNQMQQIIGFVLLTLVIMALLAFWPKILSVLAVPSLQLIQKL